MKEQVSFRFSSQHTHRHEAKKITNYKNKRTIFYNNDNEN